jgi:hypothetical protein
MYVFSDMNVNITGSGHLPSDYSGDTYNYSARLRAGWNTVYITKTPYVNIVSTDTVEGLEWYFEDDFYSGASQSSVKRLQRLFNGKSAGKRPFSLLNSF